MNVTNINKPLKKYFFNNITRRIRIRVATEADDD